MLSLQFIRENVDRVKERIRSLIELGRRRRAGEPTARTPELLR